jgi:hypothetical protein
MKAVRVKRSYIARVSRKTVCQVLGETLELTGTCRIEHRNILKYMGIDRILAAMARQAE